MYTLFTHSCTLTHTVYTHPYVHTHTRTCTLIHIHMFTLVPTYTHIDTHVYTCTHSHTSIHIYAHSCAHAHALACKHTYTVILIHTCTLTHTCTPHIGTCTFIHSHASTQRLVAPSLLHFRDCCEHLPVVSSRSVRLLWLSSLWWHAGVPYHMGCVLSITLKPRARLRKGREWRQNCVHTERKQKCWCGGFILIDWEGICFGK